MPVIHSNTAYKSPKQHLHQVSCGSCLFAVVLSLSLSKLSPWRGFWPRTTLTRLGFAHLAVISMVVSVFLVVFAIRLLRRFLYPILDPLVFVPNAFWHAASPFYVWPFPKLWFTETIFVHQNRLALFCIKTVLYTNTVFYTQTMFLLGLCKRCLRLAG